MDFLPQLMKGKEVFLGLFIIIIIIKKMWAYQELRKLNSQLAIFFPPQLVNFLFFFFLFLFFFLLLFSSSHGHLRSTSSQPPFVIHATLIKPEATD